jgi:hypothetical protein
VTSELREPIVLAGRHKDKDRFSELLLEAAIAVGREAWPGKGCDVTGNVPDTMYVLLRDEEAAGRIVVELRPFIRFSHRMDKQLARLERKALKNYPQLLQRGVFGRPVRES